MLDPFQVEAMAAVDRGENVLVAAPTGAGKTVVAEHAVARALTDGGRAFYTTPIKALSNQKFADLRQRHGADQVGLLTGDNAVNPGAPVVVMTTEVLRNMVYADSSALADLQWVVLDEVHYLQDNYRGPVWEEVLIHTPVGVRFVCLSATVSNAEELAGWIAAQRGPTTTVVEHERPVELVNHYLVADRISGDLVRLPTLVDGRPNLEGRRFDPASAPSGPRGPKGPRHRGRARWGTPRRVDVVSHLEGSALLPAIVFIFSRAACDDAVRAVIEAGIRLTTSEEAREIRRIVNAHVAHIDPSDAAALERDRWQRSLEAGVGAHHAGMVPPFKEAVEECFTRGLLKVVFATETLALGINMPARSVVVESLSKFTGDHHEDLTPSQYTQLTGRAGRRGLDPVGHALVLWSPWSSFDQVAALASSREYVLRSAFRPTYNMVVNLIRRHDRQQAHDLLGRSFAQFQADRSIARLTSRRSRRAEALTRAEEAARCELGDVDEYRAHKSAEREERRLRREQMSDQMERTLAALSPGDVLEVRGHRLAVLSVSHRRVGVRIRTVDAEARVETLEASEFDQPPLPLGKVTLPRGFDPRDRVAQRRVSAMLRRVDIGRAKVGARPKDQLPSSRPASATHPVASCPDLARHLEAAADRDRLIRQIAEDDRRISDRAGGLTRRLDGILGLLERWNVVDGWTLTAIGVTLTRIFHESDLLAALCLHEGLLDGLTPAEMAGVASMFTYEHRSKDRPPAPWHPTQVMADRARAIGRVGARLAADEDRAGLGSSPLPDPTVAGLMYVWASGGDLASVLDEEILSGGDFVRNVKALIDLLRQISMVAPDPVTGSVAAAAADALHRGVVASTDVVGGEVREREGP